MPEEDLPDGGKRVISGKWDGEGQDQVETNWCYATIESMIRNAYGKPKTKEQVARDYWTVKLGPDTEDFVEKKMDEFLPYVRDDFPEGPEGDAPARAEARRRIIEMRITAMTGDCDFSDLPNDLYQSTDPGSDRIKQALSGDHLGALGRGAHWWLLYGCEVDSAGTLTKLLVLNPQGKVKEELTAAGFAETLNSSDLYLFK